MNRAIITIVIATATMFGPSAVSASSIKTVAKQRNFQGLFNEGGRGEPLMQPTELRSVDGELHITLRLGQYHFVTPWYSEWTRAFNGELPGPTIRVKPGDRMFIRFVNELGPNQEDDNECSDHKCHNIPHFANTTNLHTHGLHISPKAPSDDVSIAIHPGESYDYVLDILPEHGAGTNWYHTHYHGSTAIQVGGGSVGSLIVEDDENSLHPTLRAMKEVILVISEHFDWGTVKGIIDMRSNINERIETIPCEDYRGVNGTGDNEEECHHWMSLNGQYLPTISLKQGEVQRWRIVHTGWKKHVALYIADAEGNPAEDCEFWELANDGVYLDAPVNSSQAWRIVPAGGRLDIAVRCNSQGEYALKSSSSIFPDGSKWGMETDWFVSTYNGKLGFISVEDYSSDIVMEAPKELPRRASYLQDLMEIGVDDIHGHHSVVFSTQKAPPGGWTGSNAETGNPNDPVVSAEHINGRLFEGFKYSWYNMQVDTVEEWTLNNLDALYDQPQAHPFHIHVNHFQIIWYSWEEEEPGLKGRFRDTLHVPINQNALIRFHTDRFTGRVVLHCHFLMHEDSGMMQVYTIEESEQKGCTYNQANNYNAEANVDDGSCEFRPKHRSPKQRKRVGSQD